MKGKKYRNFKLVVLGSTFHSEGGDWRSIFFHARRLETKGDPVMMIRVGGRRGFRQTIASLVYSPKVIVNGLGTLSHWTILLGCLFRNGVAVYLHETGYMLDQMERTMPLRFQLIRRVLGRNHLLCVSKQSEKLYQERFGAVHTSVVYECPGDQEVSSLDSRFTHIVMTGSINERKGVELFSKVADIASEKKPDWRFHWVGGLATQNKIYRSDRVEWHGWKWSPREWVQQGDVFFLSSLDDPCPLSALEAMGHGLRMVSFRGTGIAELIENLPGCRVFEEYRAEGAFKAIEATLAEKSDQEKIMDRVREVSSPESFGRRINEVMNSSS